MPTLEEHCRESEELFGSPWREVHLWLDELAGTPRYGMRHRRVRHHQSGIDEAIRLFGPQVEDIMRRHIVTDLMTEGWTSDDPFPKDEVDYVRMGLY